MSARLQQLNNAMADVVEQTHASLVQVTGGRHSRHMGAGSGVIVDSEGLVLTNAHVVRHQRSLTVTLSDGTTHAARLLARDDENDLALLQIEASDLPAADLGDTENIMSGQWVMALGHPWGVRGAATAEVVVGGGGQLPERPANGHDWLAVNLHLRPGHSGGPLVDAEGRLLGINTMMAGPDVGLVVPAHVIRAFIQEVRSRLAAASEQVARL